MKGVYTVLVVGPPTIKITLYEIVRSRIKIINKKTEATALDLLESFEKKPVRLDVAIINDMIEPGVGGKAFIPSSNTLGIIRRIRAKYPNIAIVGVSTNEKMSGAMIASGCNYFVERTGLRKCLSDAFKVDAPRLEFSQ